MKNKQVSARFGVVTIFILLLVAPFSVSAATVDLRYSEQYDVGSYVNVQVKSGNSYTPYYGEFGGMYGFTRVGGDFDETLLPTTPAYSPGYPNATMFRAFCLDINNRWLPNSNVSVEELSGYFSSNPNKANDIGRLLYNVYPDFAVTPDSEYALATQIAIWEIVHEGTGAYNVLEGDIKFANYYEYYNNITGDAIATAQGWLDDYVIGNINGELAPLLYVLESGAQPMLVQTPIPAAVWLFGSAFAGLIGFSKRRKSKT